MSSRYSPRRAVRRFNTHVLKLGERFFKAKRLARQQVRRALIESLERRELLAGDIATKSGDLTQVVAPRPALPPAQIAAYRHRRVGTYQVSIQPSRHGWCLNTLFSRTLRDVALRAIGLTGVWSAAATPQLSCSEDVWR